MSREAYVVQVVSMMLVIFAGGLLSSHIYRHPQMPVKLHILILYFLGSSGWCVFTVDQ